MSVRQKSAASIKVSFFRSPALSAFYLFIYFEFKFASFATYVKLEKSVFLYSVYFLHLKLEILYVVASVINA